MLGMGMGVGMGVGASPAPGEPTLALDFVNSNTLDPRVTFTRASAASYTDSSGTLQTAAVDGPRFDYDPVTLACKGLLIEEQRTNLLTYSEQFDNAAWSKSNSTVTSNTIAAPDGSLTADKLIPTTATSTHYVFKSVSSTVGATYTYSTYLKQGEYKYGRIERGNDGAGTFFDLQTGTTGGTNGSIVSSAITSVGNGWYRCSIVVVAATSSMFFVVVSGNNVADIATFTGDGTSGVYIWGAQLEAGAFPTSYIPTTTAEVTRAADVAVIQGANFSNWYNQSEGTLYAEADFLAAVPAQSFLLQTAGDAGNYIAMYRDSSTQRLTGRVRSSASDQAFMYATAAGVSGGLVYKQSIAYAENSIATTVNGAAVSTDTTGAIPLGMVTLGIGRAIYTDSVQLNGRIARIAYYPRRLSNSQLQTITG